MAKDPAFLFYPGDWLGGTMTMSRSHKGAYMDLLMVQFNNGHMALDDIKMVLGSDFDAMWEQKLKSKFKIDEKGNYFNEKLENEINKRRNFTDSRKKNLTKNIHMNTHMNTHMDTHMDTHMGKHMDSHMENENENENEDININKNEDKLFIEFWKIYPKKTGRGSALKAWKKIKEPTRTLELIKKTLAWQIPSDQWQKNNGQYIPNPSTYLNQTRWMDEPQVINPLDGLFSKKTQRTIKNLQEWMADEK